jgi:hypothetical protein
MQKIFCEANSESYYNIRQEFNHSLKLLISESCIFPLSQSPWLSWAVPL